MPWNVPTARVNTEDSAYLKDMASSVIVQLDSQDVDVKSISMNAQVNLATMVELVLIFLKATGVLAQPVMEVLTVKKRDLNVGTTPVQNALCAKTNLVLTTSHAYVDQVTPVSTVTSR